MKDNLEKECELDEKNTFWIQPAKRLRRDEPTYKDVKLMEGFPPPLCNQVNIYNWMDAPYNRYSYSHVREILPTRTIKGAEKNTILEDCTSKETNELINNFTVKDVYCKKLDFQEFLGLTACDGIIILHEGKKIFEQHYNGNTKDTLHIMMSVSKSIIGTLIMKLMDDSKNSDYPYKQKIKGSDKVTKFIPELLGSVYDEKTVQEVLDMQLNIEYSEDYANPEAAVWKYAPAMGFAHRDSTSTAPRNIYEYLPTLKQGVGIEKSFQYCTPNTDVLGWIASRATEKNISTLFSDEIYSKIGAMEDAFWTLDASGIEAAGGGLNMTLSAAAKFGQMILNNGISISDETIMNKSVFHGLVSNADNQEMRQSFKDGKSGGDPGREEWSYHNQFWMTNNDDGAFSAVGVYGQGIFINPNKKIVIVRQSSNKVANDDELLLSNVQICNQVAEKISEHFAK